ncbi:hypothetical protein B1775_06375 [Dehalococcoides mccartyi]|nr:hypothetical protein B1775_06375 [Dehalococcoides mccartyi]
MNGGKFVCYQYCVSLLIITLRRSSSIYFIWKTQNQVVKGLGYSICSLFLGWWRLPWGPIYTITSLWTNFTGGRDITEEIFTSLYSEFSLSP